MTKRIQVPTSILMLFVLLLSTNIVTGQDTLKVSNNQWGIGVRFNNPFGITVKKILE